MGECGSFIDRQNELDRERTQEVEREAEATAKEVKSESHSDLSLVNAALALSAEQWESSSPTALNGGRRTEKSRTAETKTVEGVPPSDTAEEKKAESNTIKVDGNDSRTTDNNAVIAAATAQTTLSKEADNNGSGDGRRPEEAIASTDGEGSTESEEDERETAVYFWGRLWSSSAPTDELSPRRLHQPFDDLPIVQVCRQRKPVLFSACFSS